MPQGLLDSCGRKPSSAAAGHRGAWSPKKPTRPRGLLQRLTCYRTGVVEATARRSDQPHAADEAPTSRTRWRTGRRCSSTSDATRRAAPPSRPRIREHEGRDTVGTAVIGIDVSKATLDACLLTPDGTTRD